MQRPCPGIRGQRCPTKALTTSRWCPPCQRQAQADRDAQRGSSTARGYDTTYRTARTELLLEHPLCEYCGDLATTADHVPSLATLRREGRPFTDATLVPACRPCNSSRGDHSTRT